MHTRSPDLRLEHLDLHDAEQGRPKYALLKDCLLAELSSGRLGPGDPLPSEKRLADRLHVARNTVRQAMSELERRELIHRVPGRGTFVDQDIQRRLNNGLELFALVTPETRTGFYPSLLHGFETASKQVQNQTIVCSTENNVDKQASAVLQLLDKHVAGVAIVPTTNPPTPAYQIRQLHERGIPVVFCHRRVEGVHAPLVTFPFEEVGRLAGDAFAEHGHRRVAFLATHRASAADGYLAGLRERMRAAGGDVPEEFTYHGSSTSLDHARQEEPIQKALKAMFEHSSPPTAILASFDSLAELIYLQLGRLGLRVPEDVSLIGFGGKWREGAFVRRLTSVAVDEAQIGRHAANLLHDIRSGNRPMDDNEEILMPLTISPGETLGPVS